jgi:hypothetical protein
MSNKKTKWDEILNKPRKIPDYGSLMSVDKFVESVKEGYFIDWDGSGYYTNGETYSYADEAVPSEIDEGKINKNFTHVIWFNK